MQQRIFLPAFLPSIIFPFAALLIGLRNPAIFDAPHLLDKSPLPAIIFLLLFGFGLTLSQRSNKLSEGFPGLAVFLLFTIGYFLLASIYNKPEVNTNNIYFAADSTSWYQRMAAGDGWKVGTRAVHPLAHILFRPLIGILSLSTSGDRFYANLILLALAGGGCVSMMWKIIYRLSANRAHALLFASLFGLSASQLVFASVIESYIFSTLCLLIFIWLLLENKPAYLLILTGIATLGITITNIAQQVLIHLSIHRNIKRSIVIFTLVLLLGAGLNIFSRSVYPLTEYFFIPGNLVEEQRFSQEVSLDRVGLMIENFLVYNITPPQPYTSIRNGMPRFNFLKGTLMEFAWFGWPAGVLWISTVALAVSHFIKNFPAKRNETILSVSMLACLMFNFLLHLGYGVEPFLYSADWTYALILFIAINLQDLTHKAWGGNFLMALILAIFFNNLWFLYLIARRVGEFLV